MSMNGEINLKIGAYKLNIEKLMPFLCMISTYKTFLNYYKFIVPSLEAVWVLLYNLITLFLLVAYVPIFFMLIKNARKSKNMIPAIIIPTMVCFNILLAAIEANGIEVLSRSYRIPNADGTNDEFGYYFSQINVWFGNMSLLTLLATFVNKKKTIIKCVVYSMAVMVLPIIVILIMNPSAIGVRQSDFVEQNITFGGGLWNIGVIGFGSLAWLGMALMNKATKWQKRFILFSVVLFLFVGIAGISRTLILMALFSFAYFVLASKKKTSFIFKTAIILAILGVAIVIEWELVSKVLERFTGEDSGTNNVRFSLWQTYLSYFKDYWLFGAPLGNVYKYYLETDLIGEHFLPHSAILNFLVRFGIIACLAYLSLVKGAFFNRRTIDNRSVYIKAGGIAYITLAFINQTGYAETIFYIMFGLLLAYGKINLAEHKNENRNNNENR